MGPLLFLIFINDIADGFDALVAYLMYADDLKIYIRLPVEKLRLHCNELSWPSGNLMGRAEPPTAECCQGKINSYWLLLLHQ